MARLDVYRISGGGGRVYVLDVQASLLENLATRAVAPLWPRAEAPKPLGELNPAFEIGGQAYVMVTQAIATVPRRELRKAVLSLASRHDDITRALDILLTGY